jgi:hypothetical protein
MAMMQEGTSMQDARNKIWMVDSKGLIVKNRPEGGVTGHKVHYAREQAPIRHLADVVKEAKPSVLIGIIKIIKTINKPYCDISTCNFQVLLLLEEHSHLRSSRVWHHLISSQSYLP